MADLNPAEIDMRQPIVGPHQTRWYSVDSQDGCSPRRYPRRGRATATKIEPTTAMTERACGGIPQAQAASGRELASSRPHPAISNRAATVNLLQKGQLGGLAHAPTGKTHIGAGDTATRISGTVVEGAAANRKIDRVLLLGSVTTAP